MSGLRFGIALVAAGLCACTGSGARGDVLGGDTRLTKTVSVRCVSGQVAGALHDIGRQCGIALSADKAAADLPITLICHDRQVAQVLRALASFLDLAWERSGPGYRIVADATALARNAESVDKMTAPLPDLIYSEANAGAGYNAAKPDQPATERLINRILRAAGKDTIRRILSTGYARFAYPERPGCLPIPQDVLDTWRAEPLGTWDKGADPRTATWFSLRCDLWFTYLVPSLRCTLCGGTVATAPEEGQARPLVHYGQSLPSLGGWTPQLALEETRPEGGALPAWTSKPAAVELADVIDTTKWNQIVEELPRTYRLGDALQELDRVTPVNVVADAFAAPQMIGVHIQSKPLADVLDELAGMTLSRWWVADGFVHLAHKQRALSRATMPPESPLARVRQRLDAGTLQIDDLAALAALPTPQYEQIWFPANPPLLPHRIRFVEPTGAGPVLRLWALLTEAQRTMALGEGLPVSRLNAAQKAAIWECVNNFDGQAPYIAPKSVLADAVSKAVIKAQNTTTRVYASRRQPGAAQSLDDPAKALQFIRGADPLATEADLLTGQVRGLWVRFMSGSIYLTSGSANLPVAWDK